MRSLVLILIGNVMFGTKVVGINLQELQKELKRRGNPWVAGETELSKWYESLSKEEKEKFLKGVDFSHMDRYCTPYVSKGIRFPLPEYFDWRNKDGKNWMSGLRAQSGCYSCWAHAFLAAWEARMNIKEGIPERDINLSEQFIISCRTDGRTPCYLGAFSIAVDVINRYGGVPDEACFPYTASNESCNNKCSDWEDRLYKITNHGIHRNVSANQVKEEILKGPVAMYVRVKEDFLYFKGGVYTPIMGKDFNHGVCFCGWHSDSGWLAKDSRAGGMYFWYRGNFGYMCWMEPKITTIIYVGCEIDDSEGNNNGEINPDEKIKLKIKLKRFGERVSGVVCTLVVDVPYVEVLQNVCSFGEINDEETKVGEPPFELNIKNNAPIGEEFLCKLKITDENGTKWEREFNLKVKGIPMIGTKPQILSFYYTRKKINPEDTIYYDDGEMVGNVNLEQYAYGVKFYAEEECSVIASLLYLRRAFSTTYTCTLIILKDNNGFPGEEIGKGIFEVGRLDWQWMRVPLEVKVDGEFWVVIGDYNFSLSLGYDENLDHNRSYRKMGSSWQEFSNGDIMIRMIIKKKVATDTGEVWVENVGTSELVISNIYAKNRANWIKFISPKTMNVKMRNREVIKVGIDTMGLNVNTAYWDTIIIHSNDPIYPQYSIPVRVLISTESNTPPKVSDIPDQQLISGERVEINLNTYVTDNEDPVSLISWDYHILGENDSLRVRITPEKKAIIWAIPPWFGEEKVVFRAKDTGGEEDEDTVKVEVKRQGIEEGIKVCKVVSKRKNSIFLTYELYKEGKVNITVYDIVGREVKELVNEVKGKGKYAVEWLPPTQGIYFCKFNIDSYRGVFKFVILK
jgi:hypothetical protein